jgi:hypothetical protein
MSQLRIHASMILGCLAAASAAAQTGGDLRATQNEPPAKIVVDPPVAAALPFGRAVVHYRTENVRILPVFGAAALSVSPRLGHLHVSVDDAPWVWAHPSGEPVIVAGLAPGPHKIRIQLMNPNHQHIDEAAVRFTVPGAKATAPAASHASRQMQAPVADRLSDQAPARIIIDPPVPEPLARGVVFLRYRTENVEIVPVFGPAALAVSPRIGHVHVTVDDTPWYWVDADRSPVIVQGLTPGRHRISIELANANHEAIDRGTVEVTVPGQTPRSR